MIAHLDPVVIARLLALIDGVSLRLLIALAAAGGELRDPVAMAKAAKIGRAECAAALETIATMKIIDLRGRDRAARAKIVYPGLLVLHPSSAETRTAAQPKSAKATVADGGRRSIVELRDERMARLRACGDGELLTAAEALVAAAIERAGGRWPVAAQLRVYEAALAACVERGPLIALEAVRATAGASIDLTKAPERYLAAVARRLEGGERRGSLAPTLPTTKIPRPKPRRGADDF